MKVRAELLLATAMLAPWTPALAQEQPVPDQSGVQDIVVTAQKRSESINTVPMSISAATGEQLARIGINETRDLVKVVPGLAFTETEHGTPVLTLRGIGFYDSSLAAKPAVSVYLDEVPLPFSVMTAGVSFDLERVEVLKGPQGTLFGQNSTGGAINYIAAKPTDTWTAGGSASFGRFATALVNGFVSGPLSDTLQLRVAGQTEQGGDWQKSYTRKATLGQRDRSSGRVTLAWQPTDRLNVNLTATGWIDKSDTQAAQLVETRASGPIQFAPWINTYPSAPRNNRAAEWDVDADLRRDASFWQVAGRVDFDVADSITLTSLTSYQKFKQDDLQDPDGVRFVDIRQRTDGFLKGVNQELRLSGDGDRLKWVIGGNYSNDKTYEFNDVANFDSTSSYSLNVAVGTPPFFSFRQYTRQKIESYAGFANADFKLTDTLALHAGARYTKTKIGFSGCSLNDPDGAIGAGLGIIYNSIRGAQGLAPNPPIGVNDCVNGDDINGDFSTGVLFNNLNEDNLSWRAGVDWQFSPQSLLYANVSRGYKAGSYPTLPASVDSQMLPVKQESVLAYEAGFKLGLLDRKLQLNGAVFYYDYSDKQVKGRVVNDPNIFGPLERLVTVPKSRIAGAELQATLVPVEGLTITSGLTYIDSKVKGSFLNFNQDGNVADFGGQAFPFTPKWQGASDIEYRFPVGASHSAFLGGNARYQSRSRAAFGDADFLEIPGYALFDLRAGIEGDEGRWRFSIWGRNVTNKFHYTNVLRLYDTVVRFAGRPATYGATIAVRFD